MTVAAINKVRALEKQLLQCKQEPVTTYHLIHAGMYARTITIPAGLVLTGALIKRATILILNGDAVVGTGESTLHLAGYHVIPASANRKQAFHALADTQLTMLFPTTAENTKDAEEEFTDEVDLLFSRYGENVINITGE
jgi:hypothetical protein